MDYYNTYVPVAKLTSIRTILSISAHNGWLIDMFNFTSTFLNLDFDAQEEIFMEEQPGYKEKDQHKYVVKLFKVIYGLKQAGRRWYETLFQTLAELGFQKSKANPAVFYIHQDNLIILLTIHVDDCMITGSNRKILNHYKSKIEARYKLKDLGPINWLLRIKIMHDLTECTISLSQTSYINSILA